MESVRGRSPRGLFSDTPRESVHGLEELGLEVSSFFLVLTGIVGSVLPGRPAAAARLRFSGICFVVLLFLMAVLNYLITFYVVEH